MFWFGILPTAPKLDQLQIVIELNVINYTFSCNCNSSFWFNIAIFWFCVILLLLLSLKAAFPAFAEVGPAPPMTSAATSLGHMHHQPSFLFLTSFSFFPGQFWSSSTSHSFYFQLHRLLYPIFITLSQNMSHSAQSISYYISPSIPLILHKSSLLLPSSKDTPHIHLTIFISALSNRFYCSNLMGHVSLP